MSSSSGPVDYLPPGISIFGGLPTSPPDLAPSIIFCVAYGLLIPLAGWRIASASSRTWILLRPAVFILVRIASFALRAAQAQGNYSVGIFIAELVLVISGFNIVCEPLIRVLEQNLHASAYNASVAEPTLLVRLLRLMRMGLIASLILGIYTGTQYNTDLTPSQVASLDTYRLATSGINLGIVGLTIVLSVLLHGYYSCPMRGTLFVVVVGCLLIIPSAYRLAAVVHTQPLLATSTKVYFYVLGSLFEFLATIAFFAVNLHDVFDLDYRHPGNGGGPIGAVVGFFHKSNGQPNHEPYGPGGTARHPRQGASSAVMQESYGQQQPVGHSSRDEEYK